MPESTLNKNFSEGSVSEIGEALAEAADADKPVVVDELTTETERTIANPDGTVTAEVAQLPVRGENDEGDLVPLDPTLEPAGDRLEPAVASEAVSFSADGSGDLARLDLGKAGSIGLSLAGETAEPTVKGGVAVYDVTDSESTLADPVATAAAEGDAQAQNEDPAPETPETSTGDPKVQVSVTARGFASHVVLAEEPSSAPEYVFDLDLQKLTPRLVDDVLQLRNAKGDVVAESAPLNMWDANVDDHGTPARVATVDAELTQTATGAWQLILRPSMNYLTDENTTYPVVVDPNISPVDRQGDSYFSQDSPTTNMGTKDNILVGRDASGQNIGYMSFSYNEFLGSTVTTAKLTMWQYASGATGCVEKPTNFRPMTDGDGPSLTWDNQPIESDADQWLGVMTANRGAGCPDTGAGAGAGMVTADVTALVNGWAGRHVGSHTPATPPKNIHNHRQAFFIKPDSMTDQQQFKGFCSLNWDAGSPVSRGCNSADRTPKLEVTFTPELGQLSWYSMTERQLTDRMGLAVNNRNGNLLVRSNDIKVNGVGMDFSMDRTYNSQTTEVGPIGRRWSLNMGPDVWLEKLSDYRYDFHAPGGTVLGSFVRKSDDATSENYDKFSAPLGGVGAELEQRDDGVFELTYRKSQMMYTFAKANGDGDVFMTGVRDRSDNFTLVHYVAANPTGDAKPRIASFEDTSGRKYYATYTSTRITKIETDDIPGVGVRTWTYEYTGPEITKSTDAEGNSTDYTYTASPNALRLTEIKQPTQPSGPPTTYISYVQRNSGGETTSVVGTVGYRLKDDNEVTAPATAVLTYSWNYRDDLAEVCEDNGEKSTVVTDPRGNKTSYCYKNRDNAVSDAKIWVYNGLGDERSQDFNADNQPVNATGASGGSTVAEYNTQIPDQMTSISEPENVGSSEDAGLTNSKMSYGSSSAGLPGGTYLPTTVKAGDNTCNRYGYDDKGRTTSTFTGASASGATGREGPVCSETSDGRKFEREYHDNGVLKRSWDANAGDNPTDDDKTVYTYWQPADTGYVAGTRWQVKNIRKPGGNCATGTNRRLCTSYTYDGAGRVRTMTDGRGNTTEFQYDKNDRTRSVNYPGWNPLTCPLGLDTKCIRYNYDANGNLFQRSQEAKFTYYTYDRLGRQTQISTPAPGSNFDVVHMTYDGAGNVIGYSQLVDGVDGAPADPNSMADTTQYTYDAANQPLRMKNAFGWTDFDHDDDGRMTKIAFEEQANFPGTTLTYDYGRNGRPEEMKFKNQNESTTYATWAYDYTDSFTATVLGQPVTYEFESPQMQERQVTSSGPAITAGTREYSYDEQRLTSATDTNGTDYEYTYDDVNNILSEKAGSTTTHYGYNMAGERCWAGSSAGNDAQKLSRLCATGPSGSTAYNRDADGNNEGLASASNPTTYNDRKQVTNIDGLAQGFLDQGNDLRTQTGSFRTINGPMGVTAYQQGGQTVFLSRTPSGQLLTARPSLTTSTSFYFITEPNGNVAGFTDPYGFYVGSYQYSPYGKTTTGGLGHFNPFRYLSEWQETNASGDPGHYKLGARYYDTSGMFTQPDALTGNMGDPRTMTAYNYAGADPINQSDPEGTYFGESVVEAGKDAADEVGEFTQTVSTCTGAVLIAGVGVVTTTATAVGIITAAPATLGTSLLAAGAVTAEAAVTVAAVRVAVEAC